MVEVTPEMISAGREKLRPFLILDDEADKIIPEMYRAMSEVGCRQVMIEKLTDKVADFLCGPGKPNERGELEPAASPAVRAHICAAIEQWLADRRSKDAP